RRRMTERRPWLRVGLVLLGGMVSLVLFSGAGCGPQPADVPPPADRPAATPADPERGGPGWVEDGTTASGIDFTYRNGEQDSPHLSILESLGGGVALIDYDGDGLLDIFLPGGGYFDGPDKKQIKGYPCKLYKNLGNWKFKDVTAEGGL